jgi:hypothetical protein
MADEPNTYLEILPRLVPPVFDGPVGERLLGALAITADSVVEDWRHALRAAYVGDSFIGGPGPAYDGLTPAGKELGLPRYPPEPWDQYHARLHRVWSDMAIAGDETSIVAQLAATGFPGAVIYTAADWPANPGPGDVLPYWSQFWIVINNGEDFGVGPSPKFGEFEFGDGTMYGITGIDSLTVQTLKGIVKQFKPAHWICRGIIFTFGGWLVGDNRSLATLTGLGLTIGAETALIGMT